MTYIFIRRKHIHLLMVAAYQLCVLILSLKMFKLGRYLSCYSLLFIEMVVFFVYFVDFLTILPTRKGQYLLFVLNIFYYFLGFPTLYVYEYRYKMYVNMDSRSRSFFNGDR